VETTETLNNGSIENAVESILQPTETEQPEKEVEETVEEIEETEEETTPEEVEEEDEGVEETDPVDDEESDEDEGEGLSDEDEEDTDTEAKDEAQHFTVKVDGKNEVVTLDELRQGYSGQKYVQKGMQEAAEARKQAEQVYSALLNERQTIAKLYEQAQNGSLAAAPVEPSRELFETDPIGYMDQKLKYDENLSAYTQQMSQLEAVSKQQSQAEEAAKQAYLQQEMANLQKVVPEFADKKQATQIRDRLVISGTELYGYEADEIAQVMDHRAIRVLNDAIKYHEIMSGKDAAKEKVKTVTRKKRPVKAGSKKVQNESVQKRKKQRHNLSKSGSIDDALALMFK